MIVGMSVLLASIGSGLTSAGSAKQVDTPEVDRVLLLRNANSAASRAIADDYARRRHVRHILTVRCQDAAQSAEAETIEWGAYRQQIETPLRAYLKSLPEVDFIVLTKGIPIRLATEGNGMNRYALDSHLAALDYEQLTGAVTVPISDPNYGAAFHAHAWSNHFWNSSVRFSHARFGGYLVTRLDGYTVADAKALTTRALEAERAARRGAQPNGPILLDVAPAFGVVEKDRRPHNDLSRGLAPGQSLQITHESPFGWFNADMQLAAERLSAHHIAVELEVTEKFAGDHANLMGYMSWGSNDPKFDPGAYHSLRFAPGAVGDTAVSSGGRTFLPTQGGQSLIADLIHQGITGIKGYCNEPLLQAVASPSILFDRYTRGWTLAESFYAASSLIGWEDIVIGDPLATAYPVAVTGTSPQAPY